MFKNAGFVPLQMNLELWWGSGHEANSKKNNLLYLESINVLFLQLEI